MEMICKASLSVNKIWYRDVVVPINELALSTIRRKLTKHQSHPEKNRNGDILPFLFEFKGEPI